MAKYVAQKCPKCRDYFEVVVSQWPTCNREYLISGFCTTCGYQLKGWRVILGRNRSPNMNRDRVPEAFTS